MLREKDESVMTRVIDLSPDSEDPAPTGRFGVATAYNGRRAVRESGRLPVEAAYIPSLLTRQAVPELLSAFDAVLGYGFDGERVVQSLGYTKHCFPRLLAPLLVVELAKRVHAGRRPAFISTARDILGL